jgi:hypothetical protein
LFMSSSSYSDEQFEGGGTHMGVDSDKEIMKNA